MSRDVWRSSPLDTGLRFDGDTTQLGTTSVQVLKYWRRWGEEGRMTPEETSVLFHATLTSTAAPWGWADDWEHQSNHVWDGCRGHPELLATKLVCLSEVLISHSVMFFLERGYFRSTVISVIPHQPQFWPPSPDEGSAALIKCLTDGLNSSICYNRCLSWWEEI